MTWFRIGSSLRWDITLQMRNGFYIVSLLLALLFIGVFWYVPRDVVRYLFPAVVLGNILVNGFFYMAALLLFEKEEGSLVAVRLTPLRPWQYLVAKCVSLSALTLLETAVLLAALLGTTVHWGWVITAVLLNTTLFALLGFLLAVRYRGLNDFLLPAVAVCTLLFLPLLDYFDLVHTPFLTALFYLHPGQAMLMLWRGALDTAVDWQLLYGLAYSTLIIALLGWLATRVLRHIAGDNA